MARLVSNNLAIQARFRRIFKPKAPEEAAMIHFDTTAVGRKVQIACRDKKLRLVTLVGLLSLVWACYPATDVTYSNPQDSAASQWLIEYKTGEEKVHLTLRYVRKRDDHSGYSNTGFMISPDQLTGLTREQAMSAGTHVQFQLKRDAGTFNFDGWFKEGNGSGHFTFTPNSSFASELNKQGLGTPTAEQQLSMALNDVGFALINELKAQDYERPTLDQLVKMGNHGVRLEYLQGLKQLGYNLKSVDFLIKMRDHGVSLNFIRELAALGYSGQTAEELIRTRDHGVSAKYINEFIAAGYTKLPLRDWITLRDHGVSSKFVQELEALGYSRLPIEQLRRMRDHGVSAKFIEELKQLGYDKVPVEQLIRLRDHGVSAKFIQKMRDQGHKDLTLDEYVNLRNRGERE
jgi:hypothetical protein